MTHTSHSEVKIEKNNNNINSKQIVNTSFYVSFLNIKLLFLIANVYDFLALTFTFGLNS